MRESHYKLGFLALLALTLCVFGRGVLAQTPAVSVSVSPSVALANPYRTVTFRFKWVIEPSEQNRLYALSYSCGKELHSSQGEINVHSARTTERYVSLTVVEDCDFMACVVRMVEGKPKTLCDHASVLVSREED